MVASSLLTEFKVEPVIQQYFAGMAVSQHNLRKAFTELGAICSNLHPGFDGYEAFQELEKDIFAQRNKLVETINVDCVKEDEKSNYIIHKLLETSAGNSFFYDVILPFYRPAIALRVPKSLPLDDREDLVADMVFGIHSSEESIKDVFHDYNFSGSLFSCVIQFQGNSNFHTYLQSAERFRAINWQKKARRTPVNFTALNGDQPRIIERAERLSSDLTPLPNELASQHDDLESAINAWMGGINKLTDQRQRILKMMIQGKEQPQIAAELDMPIATVRTNIFYLRQVIRSIIGELKSNNSLDIDTSTMLHGLVAVMSNGHSETQPCR